MAGWLSGDWAGNVFSPTLQVPVGGGVGIMSLGGAVFATATLVTNVSTAETTLFTYTLPGGAFNKVGQAVSVRAWGTQGGVASGTTGIVRMYFGTANTTLLAGTAAVNNYFLEAYIIRSGASTQEWAVRGQTGGAFSNFRNGPITETDTANIVIKITGTSTGGGTNGNVSARAMIVEFFNA